MEEERRRKRDLTPLSGEVNAATEWVPPVPVEEKQRVKKEKRLPQTRGGMILAGVRRSLVILVLLGGLTALAALLIVQFSDMESGRAFPLAFYLGGALLALPAVEAAADRRGRLAGRDYWAERRLDAREAFSMSFVYGAFGVALIGVGVLLDSLL